MTRLAPPDGTLIRLRTPRDVLATVPRLLGYRPRDSIVFLSTHDEGATSTMRVDLPAGCDAASDKRFVATLIGMLGRAPGLKKTLVVVYSGEPLAAGGDLPRAALVRRLVARLVDAGFDVHDVLCVAADAWSAYDGPEAGAPHRLDELDEAAPGSEGCGPVAASVDELATLRQAGPFARRAFDEALDCRLRKREAPEPVAAAEAALALEPHSASSDQLATALDVLLDVESRDVAMFTWAWGAERGRRLLGEIELIADGEIGPDDDSLALDLLGIGSAPPPNRERVDRAIALMVRVAALTADDLAHVPLTVLAWLHWSRGQSSIAGRFIAQARRLDPAYGLAELLELALGQGLVPNWAYLAPRGGGEASARSVASSRPARPANDR